MKLRPTVITAGNSFRFRNVAALLVDDNGRTASAKRWARATIGSVGDNVSIEKGRTVMSIDHTLWERELAEYISLHPDLEDLPPPVFPRRRSRLALRIWRFRQVRRARRAQRRARRAQTGGYRLIIIVTLFVLETLVLGAIVGWWLGWHL